MNCVLQLLFFTSITPNHKTLIRLFIYKIRPLQIRARSDCKRQHFVCVSSSDHSFASCGSRTGIREPSIRPSNSKHQIQVRLQGGWRGGGYSAAQCRSEPNGVVARERGSNSLSNSKLWSSGGSGMVVPHWQLCGDGCQRKTPILHPESW